MPSPSAIAAGAAVALLVQREHQGAVGRRRVEGARGMAQMMFEVQHAQVRRFPEHVEQAAVVEFAPQLAERFRLIVAAGNRREGRQLRAHPRLPDPRAQRAAGHGDAFDAAPSGPGALQAKSDRLARNPGGRAPANQFAFLHGGENAIVGEQCGGGIVSEAGKPKDVQACPLFLADRQNLYHQHRGVYPRKAFASTNLESSSSRESDDVAFPRFRRLTDTAVKDRSLY